MVLLIEYKNNTSEVVNVPDTVLEGIGWKEYVKCNFTNVSNAYKSITESLYDSKSDYDVKE